MNNSDNSDNGNPAHSRRWRVSDKEAQIIRDVRAGLHLGGFKVVPVDETGKKPAFARWPDYKYPIDPPEDLVPRTLNNSGEPTKAPHFATGVKTTGIFAVDIDIDDPILARSARVAFEQGCGMEAPYARIRKNSGRVMLIYRCPPNMPTVVASNANKDGAIEMDANHDGQFAMIHGRHPSGVYVEFEGDQPWDIPLKEFDVLSFEDAKAGYEASCNRLGIEVKKYTVGGTGAMAGTYESRSASKAAEHAADLLSGISITPAAMEIFRHLLFEYNAPPHFVEEFVRALIERGRRMNPNCADRYENLLNQMDPTKQRIPLQGSMERRWREWAEEMIDGTEDLAQVEETGQQLEKNRAALAAQKMTKDHLMKSFMTIARRLPDDLLDDAIAWLGRQRK